MSLGLGTNIIGDAAAFAAGAAIFGGPIGVGAGAVIGVFNRLGYEFVGCISNILIPSSPNENTAVSITKFVFAVAGGFFAAAYTSTLMGTPLTFKAAAIMGLTGCFTIIVVPLVAALVGVCAMGCFRR